MILALDTTGPHCSVAIGAPGDIRAHISERIGRGHAERLGPMVGEAFAAAGLAADDIARLAVCRGPGSFTGLRVGLSYALGFVLPRRLPVLGLDATRIAAEGTSGIVAVRIDVRRGETGWAAYRDGLQTHPFRVEPTEDADAAIAALGPERVAADPVPDMRAAIRLAAVADPAEFPASALYARGPDAKLPGGVEP